MIDFFGTVEGENVDVSAQVVADDVQQEEIAAEELLDTLTEEGGGNPVENEGDDAQKPAAPQTDAGNLNQAENDKFSRRISAALKSQKEQIYRELGMSESEVRELIRAHKAEQMHREDPEISKKAAQEIIRLREQAQPQTNSQVEAYKAGIQSLLEDGWTREQLAALAADETVREHLAEGMTLRQAATAFLFGQRVQPQKKMAVPTVRAATASAPPGENRFYEMSDKEFDAFAKRAREAAYAGKRVTFR